MSEIGLQKTALLKLLGASAVLALFVQLIYDFINAGGFPEENVASGGFSVNINDLLFIFLYEYLFCFFATFLILLAIRFLYIHFFDSLH